METKTMNKGNIKVEQIDIVRELDDDDDDDDADDTRPEELSIFYPEISIKVDNSRKKQKKKIQCESKQIVTEVREENHRKKPLILTKKPRGTVSNNNNTIINNLIINTNSTKECGAKKRKPSVKTNHTISDLLVEEEENIISDSSEEEEIEELEEILISDDENNLKCKKCNFLATEKIELDRHMLRHALEIKPIVTRNKRVKKSVTQNSNNLFVYYKRKRQEAAAMSATTPSDIIFKCSFCIFWSTNRSIVEEHITIRHVINCRKKYPFILPKLSLT